MYVIRLAKSIFIKLLEETRFTIHRTPRILKFRRALKIAGIFFLQWDKLEIMAMVCRF